MQRKWEEIMKHGLRSESKAGKNHRENSIGQVKKPERRGGNGESLELE